MKITYFVALRRMAEIISNSAILTAIRPRPALTVVPNSDSGAKNGRLYTEVCQWAVHLRGRKTSTLYPENRRPGVCQLLF